MDGRSATRLTAARFLPCFEFYSAPVRRGGRAGPGLIYDPRTANGRRPPPARSIDVVLQSKGGMPGTLDAGGRQYCPPTACKSGLSIVPASTAEAIRAHEAGPIRLDEVPAVQIDRVKGGSNKMWSSVAILLGLPAPAQRRHDVGRSGQGAFFGDRFLSHGLIFPRLDSGSRSGRPPPPPKPLMDELIGTDVGRANPFWSFVFMPQQLQRLNA